MKNGLLWGMLLLFCHINLYFIIGFVFIWNSESEFSTLSALSLIGKSIAYLIYGFISLLVVLFISINLSIKDTNIKQTINNHWPLILAIVYWILPDFMPGPIDDIFLSGICIALETWFMAKTKKKID